MKQLIFLFGLFAMFSGCSNSDDTPAEQEIMHSKITLKVNSWH